MGHKKRNPPQRPPARHPSDPAASAAADASSPPPLDSPTPPPTNPSNHKAATAPSDSAEFSSVKAECERALTALRRGNHTKALRLMKEAVARHESSALVHRVHGTIAVKVSALLDDPNAKLRHLRAAIDSGRRAVALSPFSIEFAHFYANLLYDAATDGRGYEEVVQECERALAIADPVDPAKESLQDESQQKLPTAEARIAHVQQELRALIQKSNIASISSWMKNLGNGAPGEERFRLIPMRRISEDPMEVRLVQTPRRPNEIKKATKTPEERRKEIEVRVAAARLMQQKPSGSPQSPSEDDNRTGTDSPASSSGLHRLAERRKNSSKKMVQSTGRMDQVRAYWNSMSIEKQLSFLAVRVMELRAHYVASKDSLAQDILSEAISFAEANRTWKFWTCFRCDEKFTDCDLHIQHVVQEHMGSLSTKLQSVLPLEVDGEWIEMLLNGNWKPIDVSAAVKMLEEEQLKCHSFIKDVDSDGGSKDKDCLSDYWSARENSDSSPSPQHEELKDQDVCNGFALESKDIEMRDCYDVFQRWPLSDDSERTKLLERIQSMFQLFIKHKSLSASHLHKVTTYAIEEIQGFQSGSMLLNNAIDQSPLCICFLGVSHLKKILKFLQELSQSCGLGRVSDKDSPGGDADCTGQGTEAQGEINVILDSSRLLLDGHSFIGKVGSLNTDNLGSNDGMDIMPDTNALFSWLTAGPAVGEELSAWAHLREEKLHQGIELLQMLEKEFYLLQSLCEKKCEHLSYEEALQSVENLCFEELKRREQAGKFLSQSYESILRKRQEELVEQENDEMLISSRFELDVISNVLKDAQAFNVSQFGYDDALSTSRLCDLDSDEADDWRIHDYFQQTDTCIDLAIRRQKDQLSMELNKIDARILQNMTGMQQLEVKLGSVSAFDHRIIILPLVKSFLRLHLEDLVDKDAAERSDAAREAFLAELALDAKKNANKDTKNAHEKSKEKKRNKDYRKAKDPKAPGHNEQLLPYLETPAQFSEFLGDGDILEQDLVSSGDYLKKQEEELKEERELVETLEHQRQIEDEAKQNTPKNIADESSAMIFDSNFNHQSGFYGATSILLDDIEFGDFSSIRGSIDKNHENTQLGKSTNKSSMHDQPLNLDEQQLNGHYKELQDEIPADGVRNGYGQAKKGIVKSNGAGRIPTSGKPCTDSSLQKAKRTSSQSHAKYKQGSSAPIHDDNVPLDQLKSRQAPRLNTSSKIPEGTGKPFSFSKENFSDFQSHHDLHKNHASVPGESEVKISRQLHSEKYEEEKFQEDLKEAVRQSLEADDHGSSTIQADHISNGKDVLGTGLTNAVGEYNCFLNVIIQSLWHLRRFRDEFLKTAAMHVHVGNPCAVCALYDIFTALSKASKEGQREPVSPTSLRVALSNLYPNSTFFQEAQMNDASEVLAVIFDCLHKSYTPSGDCKTKSHENNSLGSWDCGNNACIAHLHFGMDISERMNCYNCNFESRHLRYTTFFHNINASSLRTAKSMCAESSFDELLEIVEMNHQLACDLDAGGCGKLNYIHHILSSPPHIFTTVLGWQNTNESADDISATLAAIDMEVDIGVLYRGIDKGCKHSLISVVCYYGQHYHCFAYEHEQWVMYDDQTVKVVGRWDDVLTMCRKGHLQPQVLFFEAVN